MMLIKRYTGTNLSDIQRQVDKELGPDAVITMTRLVEHGVLQHFFLDDEYEVTVMIDEGDLKRYQITRPAADRIGCLSWENSTGKVVHLPVTGPLQFDPVKPNLLILLGKRSQAKTLALVKLALKLKGSTPYDAAIVSADPQDESLSCLSRVFDLKYSSCEHLSDLKLFPGITLIDLASDQEAIGIPQEFATQFHAAVETANDPREQMAILDQYRGVPIRSLIITNLDQNPSLISLIELTRRHPIPISYLAEGASFTLADADDLEIRVTNQRLKKV